MLNRRSVLHALTSCAVVCTTGNALTIPNSQPDRPFSPVPWSAGSEPPKTEAPPQATDCHFHIYDPRFPFASTGVLKPGPATVADYRLLQKRLGTSRCVIVQPSSYGTDNRCLLDALHQLGLANARGVAVVNTTVTDHQLHEMHAAGVRGIRFNLLQAGATTLWTAPIERDTKLRG